jgi:hypothetical protein
MYSSYLIQTKNNNNKSIFKSNINQSFQEDASYEYKNYIYNTHRMTESDLSEKIEKYIDTKEEKLLYKNMIHKIDKDDPPNKLFNFGYSINYYSKYDYLFKFQGNLSKKEFIQKTQKIRTYPLHLKQTLFLSKNLADIRNKDFSFIKINFNEIRKKGNKLYKKKKFHESLETYFEAYSLLNYLQFTGTKSYNNLIQNNMPILDSDIKEVKVFSNILDDESEYNVDDTIVSILLCLSNNFMELRNFNDALNCLNEAHKYDDSNPNVLFRRSQCILYNKESTSEEYKQAIHDINKACNYFYDSKKEPPIIFKQQKKMLQEVIYNKNTFEKNQILKFISDAVAAYLKYNNKESWENYIRKRNIQQDIQFKVLNIMKKKYKMIIMYYIETKNKEKLNLAFEEREQFMEKFMGFEFFYNLNINNMLENVLEYDKNDGNLLTHEIKEMFKLKGFLNFLEYFKNKIADSIFQDGNFNVKIITYAISKINSEKKDKNKDNNESSESYLSQIENVNKNNNTIPDNFSISVTFILLLFSLFFISYQYFLFLSNINLDNPQLFG